MSFLLEDLIKMADNEEELIAFLLEYANFFDEKDLKVKDKVNSNAVASNINEPENIGKKALRLKSKSDNLVRKSKNVQVHKFIKDGLEKHVDPLCVKVCNKLFEKNIYLKDIVITDDKIKLVLDKLSKENKEIFAKSMEINPRKYTNTANNYVIEVLKCDKSGSNIKTELVKAARFLKMQDVQSNYMDKKRFLMSFCDCEKVEGHTESGYNKNIKILFDPNKMEKSFEEYLKDKNVDKLYSPDNEKIYMDEFYLNGHKNYLEYLKNNSEN